MTDLLLTLPRQLRSVRLVDAPETVVQVAPEPSPTFPTTAAPRHDETRLADLLADLRCELADVEQRRRQNLTELRAAALELAVAAASQLLQCAIDAGDFAVEQVIHQALDTLAPRRPVTVSLHPDDLQLLRERTRDQPLELPCDLQSDSQLPRGDCRVELDDGVALLRSTAAALSDLHHTWQEHLDDTPLERRRPDGTGRSLQRFPDRRETA